jgi:hypothetical protein
LVKREDFDMRKSGFTEKQINFFASVRNGRAIGEIVRKLSVSG